METILEQQRRYHEERERLCDSMVKEMVLKKNSVRFYYIFDYIILFSDELIPPLHFTVSRLDQFGTPAENSTRCENLINQIDVIQEKIL